MRVFFCVYCKILRTAMLRTSPNGCFCIVKERQRDDTMGKLNDTDSINCEQQDLMG